MSKEHRVKSETEKPPESYTVLARRYRPQQFSDLVGQEAVARALINALESNRVAHAYLFTGPRGVGKTSTARILAKALNCERGPTAKPCDQCDLCRSIAGGDDVDVLEIDGASNNSVEDVRQLRENAHFRPSRSRYRIYIIDEVHMLAASAYKSAFNALLKILEEPPPHVKFIFATTEVEKIPATILSRCQRFDFAAIGTERIRERLRQVVAEEKVHADDEALELIARRAAGSMRDAQSLLDQLLAFSADGKSAPLSADQVHRLLGTAQDDRIIALASAVLERDPKRALELLGQGVDEGLNLGELLDRLIEYWRDLMVVNCAGTEAPNLNFPPRHHGALQKQAASLSLDTILAGLDILSATKARLRTSSHGRVLVEMALVRLGRLDDLVSVNQLLQRLGPVGGGKEEDRGSRTENRGSTIEDRGSSAGGGSKRQEMVNSISASDSPSSILPPPPSNPASLISTLRELTENNVDQIWREVVAQVGPMLGSHLETAEGTAISGPNTLVVRFPAGYNHHCDYCREPNSVARVQEALKKITGCLWNLRVETVRQEVADSSAPASETETAPSRYRRQRTEALQEPLVKRAIELLGAQIVQVDDDFGTAPAAPPIARLKG